MQDIFDAPVKIYGFLQRAGAKQRVDVRLQVDLQMILEYPDAVDDELEVVALELLLLQHVPEYVHRRLGDAVDPQNGVAPV